VTSAGGTVASEDGSFQIQFPPGAVATPVTVTYTTAVTTTQPLPPGAKNVLSFTLDARDANGNPATSFQASYTLTLIYTDAQLAALGVDESKLQVYVFDGVRWVKLLPCPGCSVDTAKNMVTIVLDHFTEFALAGDTRAVPAGSLFMPLLRR
jgi:hypothetical protein